MAHRIEGAVVWGEIDNTREGRTSGRLWLLGQEVPVTLELVGDCWRDLAGTRLTFRNPHPRRRARIALHQKGLVGDMTASRKSRVPLCGPCECLDREARGEEVPAVWKNLLSLEWFSETDGRVVIESTDFDLHLSERLWAMDEDAEEAQKLANLHAMRDFLASLTGREPGGDPDAERLTEAYQELLGKYSGEADAEQKEAFVMGWDRLLGDMAEAFEQQHRGGPVGLNSLEALGQGILRIQRHFPGTAGEAPECLALLSEVTLGLREMQESRPPADGRTLQSGLQHCLDLLAETLRRVERDCRAPGGVLSPALGESLIRELTPLIEGLMDLLGALKGE
ncbi:MAG: hypothetical protein MUF31_09435 [Akkermansiaceae bacterium]|jgi:hypothetical protein|nr:hypothetical protein [Akkermansiaceae bacterium]